MPGIPGIEVLENITKSNPTIVAIVITGYATVTSLLRQ
jgi:DNA-binding NtrC family response regulator